MKESLFGKTLIEIQTLVAELDLPKFTASQITDWLYKKPVSSIDEMTNLSKKARDILNEKYEFGLIGYTKVQESTDGT